MAHKPNRSSLFAGLSILRIHALMLSLLILSIPAFGQIQTVLIEISGQVLNEQNKTPVPKARVVLYQSATANTHIPFDTLNADDNGAWRTNLMVKEKVREIWVEASSDGFRVRKEHFYIARNSPPANFNVGIRPVGREEKEVVRYKDVPKVIYFDEGEEVFKEKFAGDLLTIRNYVKRISSLHIHLHCFVGKWEKGGRKLAEKRGETVKKFLVSLGVPAYKIKIFTRNWRVKIFDRPKNEKEESMNRRVGLSFPKI